MAAADPPREGAGRKVDGYLAMRELGRGAFGVVHLVRRVFDGKDFAMKCVPLAGVPLEQRVAAVAELSLLRDLHHPGCVQYVSAVVADSELRVVTEFCGGGDLSQWVDRLPERRFPDKSVLPLAVSLLHALEYLHLKRIMHRDIKPANILMAAGGVPKLADFGVSRSATSTLRGRTLAGTPAFMAPELLLLEDEAEEENTLDAGYTESADVWSLGATFFALLNGGMPPLTLKGAIKKVARDPASWRVPPLPSDTPPEAVALVSAMLVADPAARPSAAALLGSPLLEGVGPLSAAAAPGLATNSLADAAAALEESIGREKTASVALEAERAKAIALQAELEALRRRLPPLPPAAPIATAPSIPKGGTEDVAGSVADLPLHVHSPACNHAPAPEGAVLKASKAGDLPALQAALDAGGSTEEADWDGCTALWYAAAYGRLEPLCTLLAAGANPAATTKRGRTPLHLAAREGHTPVVALLLAIPGVDPLARTRGGETPLDLALINRRNVAASLLRADSRVAASLVPGNATLP